MNSTISSPKLVIVERILLTLWVGGLWAIGCIAVPILFNVLDDRRMAGELAAPMFSAISIIGLVCGVLLMIGMIYCEGRQCVRNWRCWVLAVMVVFIIVSQFVLYPMMVEVKAQGLVEGSDLARRFGQLHGASSVLYMATSLLGPVLIIFGLHGRDSR